MSKVCIYCLKEKELEDFDKRSSSSDGRGSRCKECRRQHQRDNPNTKRNYRLKRKFGISLDEYNELLEAQANSCAICNIHESYRPNNLAVDHNHDTGEVRGLLCHHCNSALGLFQDSSDILLHAANYLNKRGTYASSS